MYVFAPSLLTLPAPVWNTVSQFISYVQSYRSILILFIFWHIHFTIFEVNCECSVGSYWNSQRHFGALAINWKDNFTSLVASQARSYSSDLYKDCTTIAQANLFSSSIKSAGINITKRVLLHLEGWSMTREKTE